MMTFEEFLATGVEVDDLAPAIVPFIYGDDEPLFSAAQADPYDYAGYERGHPGVVYRFGTTGGWIEKEPDGSYWVEFAMFDGHAGDKEHVARALYDFMVDNMIGEAA